MESGSKTTAKALIESGLVIGKFPSIQWTPGVCRLMGKDSLPLVLKTYVDLLERGKRAPCW